MKRLLIILAIYTAIIFGLCMGCTAVWRDIPALNIGDEGSYRFARGMLWFLTVLPAILLSGFTISCATIWQKHTENSRNRFSPAMFSRYRHTLFVSIIIVLVLALNYEIFLPKAKTHIAEFEAAPAQLKAAMDTAKELLEQDQPELAYQYALRAVAAAPNDASAAELALEAKDAVDIAHDKALHEAREQRKASEEKPLYDLDHAYTAYELLEKARAAANEGSWFDAHYWAHLASDGANTETIATEATTLANEAWNHIKNPQGFDNEAELDFYRRKMAAYEALSAGNTSDNLTAYYGFLALTQMPGHENDPDVVKFLELAREAVEHDYFFIDETEHIDQLANSHNIYFSLESPVDGSRHVFFIKGAMDSSEDGKSVRYLEELHIVTYSKAGRFLSSLYTPIAKVIAYPLSELDELTVTKLGVQPSWKTVPFLMLQAIDRETKGAVVVPSYSVLETGLPKEICESTGFYTKTPFRGSVSEQTGTLETSRTLLLPMPYSDFVAINRASAGPDRMDLLTLKSFLSRVTDYGFSREVFNKNLVGRGVYPLFLLVLCIAAATMGWNYRIEDKKVQFKFRWIFLVPLYGAIMYFVLEITTYLYDMLNYVLVGAFGTAALFVAFIVYALMFFAVSVNFLARHE